MARVISVTPPEPPRGLASYVLVAIVLAVIGGVLVAVAFNPPSGVGRVDPRAASFGVLLIFIGILIPVMRARALSSYNRFRSMLSRIRIEGNKIIAPPGARVSYGILEAGRYFGRRGSTRGYVSFSERGVIGVGEEDLSLMVEPYLYVSCFPVAARRKPRRKQEFYIRSNAIRISSGSNEVYLALMGPMNIAVDKRVLKVSKDRDYAEASIEPRGDGSLAIRINYSKHRTRSARLVLHVKASEPGPSLIEATLAELREAGSKEIVFTPAIPDDIVVIPIPGDRKAFNVMEIDNSWIKEPIREKHAIYYISGFSDAKLRLVLDVPYEPDVVDETNVKPMKT